MADHAKEITERLSQKLKLPPEQIRASCERGSAEELLKNVDSQTAKRVESVLGDPEKARALLNSPEAQALMKLLEGS